MTWLIVFCSLVFVLGLFLGALAESFHVDRDPAVRRARVQAARREQVQADRAAAYFRGVRQSALIADTRGFISPNDGTFVEWSPPEVHHEDKWLWSLADEQGIEAAERREAMARRTPPVYHQPRELGPGPGMSPARPETDEEFTARLGREADAIIAWSRAAAAPYPDGDQ